MAEPMYRQIADDLRIKIESGEIAPGAQLPTEIEIMDRYDASRNTVRDAIKLLTIGILVETRPGQGTFVVEKINPFITTLTADPQTGRGGGEEDVYQAEVEAGGRKPTYSKPRVEVQEANAAVADALRLEPGAQVVSRHQERFIDLTAVSLKTSFYPMHIVERAATRLIQATDIEGGTVAYLAELEIKQVGYRDSVEVRPPNENEATFFRIPADGRVPVFEVYRIAFDAKGGRVRLTITVYPVDRNRLVINVGSAPPRTAQATDQHDRGGPTTTGSG